MIGDGMAGLVAAWDLSRKAYPVDLFYAGGRPAEGLIAAFPALTPEALDGELEAMRRSGVTLTAESLTNLFQEVEGCDAVFVDVPVPRAWPGLTGCRGFRDAECGGRTGTCLFRRLAVTRMGRAPPSHGRRKAAGPP